jgi:hypothetical protein
MGPPGHLQQAGGDHMGSSGGAPMYSSYEQQQQQYMQQPPPPQQQQQQYRPPAPPSQQYHMLLDDGLGAVGDATAYAATATAGRLNGPKAPPPGPMSMDGMAGAPMHAMNMDMGPPQAQQPMGWGQQQQQQHMYASSYGGGLGGAPGAYMGSGQHPAQPGQRQQW